MTRRAPATGRPDEPGSAAALFQRLFQASLACAELMTSYLGLRLGLYDALATAGPATPEQLADRAGIAARYAREWLEQQAAAGIVEVADPTSAPDARLYRLPAGHAEALTRSDSPLSIAPLALLPIGGIAHILPRLLEVFRTGEGIDYQEYGPQLRGGQAGLNQPVFLHALPGWIRTSLPVLHRRLHARGGRVADVGCGAGWSSIALAREYPQVRVDGFDLDPGAVADARANATAAGVADRVDIQLRNAADPALSGSYDLVCIFDSLHDMPRPVEVLRSCRRLRADGGSVLLLEPKAAHAYLAPADEVERFLYAVSVLHCLPVGMSQQPSVSTGTLLRPETLRGYARAAGFADVEILPVQHRFHRLYHAVG